MTKNSSSNSLSLMNSTMNFLLLVPEEGKGQLLVAQELQLIMGPEEQIEFLHLVAGQERFRSLLLVVEEVEGRHSMVESV
jgi:hypothetical protein